ncbi:MAG: hypothetical protein J7K04_00385 [Spirochaetales bacterium]|nr:hypothetical protein [Spirochaetales bacterium]
MKEKGIISVDIGSSSFKIGLFSLEGELLHFKKETYPLKSGCLGPRVNPEIFWNLLKTVLRRFEKVLKEYNIISICIDGPARSNFLCSLKGLPLTDCYTWLDNSMENDIKELKDIFPLDELRKFFGASLPLSSTLPIIRLYHFSKTVSAIEREGAFFSTPKDYLIFKLTGKKISDPLSMISIINIKTKKIVTGFLERLSIVTDILPELKEPWEIAGHISDSASKTIGLESGIPVVTGTIDSLANAFGTGLFSVQKLLDISGTTEVVLSVCEYDKNFPQGLSILPYTEGKYLIGGPMQSGGATIDWWKKKFGKYYLLKRDKPIIKSQILFYPYLNGERAPLWNSKARGIFFGISMEDGPEDMEQAIMEGIAFNIKRIKNLIDAFSGKRIKEVIVTGGGARNKLWNTIKANILEIPVSVSKYHETALAGSAILGFLGLNKNNKIQDIFPVLKDTTSRYFPEERYVNHYRKVFDRFIEIENNMINNF